MMAIPALGAIGIGVGVSALEGLFGESDKDRQARIDEQIQGLRDDQKALYDEAMGGLAKHFADVGSSFVNNLSAYREQLIQQAPERRREILEIYSEKNPAVARYIENLQKGYREAEKRVDRSIRQANTQEISNWQRQGISGGTIGRMIAGNQMERLEKGEGILTSKMAQVLQPQAQIAQAGMGALGQAEGQQAGALRQAGLLGVQVPLQLGTQQASLQNALTQQMLGQQAGAGALGFQAGQVPQAPGLFQQAGGQFIGSGIERLLAPTPRVS